MDNFSGLEGSILWHGDWSCDNKIGCVDANLHRWFLANYPECCIGACPAPLACRADFDRDGAVGLQDLSNLLSSFGACEGDPLYNPLYDLVVNDCDAIDDIHNVCERDAENVDECIQLEDLALMLSSYGLTCPCDGGGGGGGGGFAGFGGGEGEDPEFVEWVRQATPEEILEWYEIWCAGGGE